MFPASHLSNGLESNVALAQLILETTPNPYVLKDKKSIYRFVNKAFCQFTGMSEKELIGRSDFDVFPTSDAEEYVRDDQKVMSGRGRRRKEWQVRSADGTCWLQVLKTPVMEEGGEVVGVLCSVSDITELKKAQAKVETLSGFIPICAKCKKIRDDKGYWTQVEVYIKQHSQAQFTHGLCPDCIKDYFNPSSPSEEDRASSA